MEHNLSKNVGIDLDEFVATKRQTIMIVDDDPDNVTLLKQILRTAGFDVVSANSGDEAVKKLTAINPDLVLLDIMMPGLDGWETFNYLRKISDIPIIYVTALVAKDDLVKGLMQGADDYITKPFHNAEVIARIRTVLRRSGKPQNINRYVFHKVGLTIDLTTKEVELANQKVQLTHKEFEILTLLARNAPNVVPYATITQQVWQEETEEARKRAKYLIYLLRRKFKNISPESEFIVNVDRLGYKLLAD